MTEGNIQYNNVN